MLKIEHNDEHGRITTGSGRNVLEAENL